MTNLEKIKAALNMGWSTKFSFAGENYIVISVLDNEVLGVICERDKSTMNLGIMDNQIRITGYLYAGELAGNTIPEGQRFRVKRDGSIYPFSALTGWNKSEIEPYFE